MELTGKCRTHFKEWYIKQNYCILAIQEYGTVSVIKSFFAMDIAFKYGVYIDFFDSIGIKYWVAPFYNHDLGVMNEWAAYNKEGLLGKTCETQQEARIEAIKEANKIYNELI